MIETLLKLPTLLELAFSSLVRRNKRELKRGRGLMSNYNGELKVVQTSFKASK